MIKLVTEKNVTAEKLANRLKVSESSIKLAIKEIRPKLGELFTNAQGEYLLNERQAAMVEATVRNEKLTPTKELASLLGTSKKVILENARKCLPNKVIESGKQTFWTEAESTVLLDYMKKNKGNNSGVTLKVTVDNISTDLTPALMIKQAMELMNKGYQLELERIKAEKAKLEQDNQLLQIELDESKEWYTIKRMQKINPDIHFKYSLLKKESQILGYDIKKVFDQNYGEVNAYHKDVYESLYFDTVDFE